jgi:hypothetical protein
MVELGSLGMMSDPVKFCWGLAIMVLGSLPFVLWQGPTMPLLAWIAMLVSFVIGATAMARSFD